MTKENSTLLITAGIIFAVVGGLSFFGIQPLLARVNSLRTERSKTEKEYKELEARVATLEQLSRQPEEIESLAARALTYLPTTIASSPFLMDVAAMAGSSQTSVPSVTFQPPDPKKGSTLAEYPITMTVEGGFDGLKTFLHFLEENLRFASITSASMSLQQEGLSLQLTGSLFSKPEEKKPKDTSLTIDNATRSFLEARRIFGQTIDPKGPGRPDPFAGL